MDIGFTIHGEFVRIFTINPIMANCLLGWVLIFIYGVATYNILYPRLPTAPRNMDVYVPPFTNQDADAMMWSDVGQE